MSATSVYSPAQLDYGLDTQSGRITKSAECPIGLEAVENDPFCFAVRVPAPLPEDCLLYTSPSPRDRQKSRMPSSA